MKGFVPMLSPPDVPYFRGLRVPATGEVVVRANGRELPLRLDLWNHSPDGFEWGYGGSGPAQLALAMLCYIGVPDELAVRFHQDFKWDVIAKLDRDEWVVTVDQVKAWVNAHPPVPAPQEAGDE